MKIKDVIGDSVPARVKARPGYRLFLVWADESGAKTIGELKRVLEGELDENQSWLDSQQRTSRLGMKNHLLRATAKYIDFLKSIRKDFMKHL